MTSERRLLAGLGEAVAAQGDTPFLAFWRDATEAAHREGRAAPMYGEAREAWDHMSEVDRAIWGG